MEEDLSMAPTDADVATTQLSSTMPASAATLFSAPTFPASSRALREVHRGGSPSVTQTLTTLPDVRESAGEAHDLGHGASSPEARVNVVAPTVVDMSFSDSDEEDVASSLAGNRFAVLSDNRSDGGWCWFPKIQTSKSAITSGIRVRCGSGRRFRSDSPGNSH